jgi:hypothetical protein
MTMGTVPWVPTRATRAVILAAIATVVGGGSVAAVEVRSLGEARKAATTVEGSARRACSAGACRPPAAADAPRRRRRARPGGWCRTVPRNADATRCEKETGGAPPRVHLGILKARPGEAPQA